MHGFVDQAVERARSSLGGPDRACLGERLLDSVGGAGMGVPLWMAQRAPARLYPDRACNRG